MRKVGLEWRTKMILKFLNSYRNQENVDLFVILKFKIKKENMIIIQILTQNYSSII